MPSTSEARRPASRMALRTASTAMARVERPEPREYSVSPTPTMQYLSLSVFVATGGSFGCGSAQAAERAEVELEVCGAAGEEGIAAAAEGRRIGARDALGPHERFQPRSQRLELRRLAGAPPLGAPRGQVSRAGTEIVGRRRRRRRRRRLAEESQRHLL